MRAEKHISSNATTEFEAVIGLKHHVTAIRMRCWPKHPNTFTNLKRQFTNGTMSDGKRKNIVAFGKGRKRRREQLRRHARSASTNETDDSSKASTAVPVTPTRATVSASTTDRSSSSTVQVVSPPSVTVEPDSFLSIPSENSHPVVRQRV